MGLALVASASALAVTACKPGAQQAAAENAPPPLAALPLSWNEQAAGAPAPVDVDLPPGPPAPLGAIADPGDDYAFLDRADFLNYAFADAPPDYAFDDDGVWPWVWASDDGYIRIVEPLPYGDRYYYFEPGDDEPFLIWDPDYAYGYSDGELVAVYDSSGRMLPQEDLQARAAVAGAYLSRARAFQGLATRTREPVAETAWAARRGQIQADVSRWNQAEERTSGWRQYHQSHLAVEQAHWAPERFRRTAEAARFFQQVHDPDAASRNWSAARQAETIAKRAHVQIASAAPNRAGQAYGPGRGAEGGRRDAFAAAGGPAPGFGGRGPEARSFAYDQRPGTSGPETRGMDRFSAPLRGGPGLEERGGGPRAYAFDQRAEAGRPQGENRRFDLAQAEPRNRAAYGYGREARPSYDYGREARPNYDYGREPRASRPEPAFRASGAFRAPEPHSGPAFRAPQAFRAEPRPQPQPQHFEARAFEPRPQPRPEPQARFAQAAPAPHVQAPRFEPPHVQAPQAHAGPPQSHGGGPPAPGGQNKHGR